jgi:hypothetical protein
MAGNVSRRIATAACNAWVWGCEVGNSLPFNLTEFQRYRAGLKFA